MPPTPPTLELEDGSVESQEEISVNGVSSARKQIIVVSGVRGTMREALWETVPYATKSTMDAARLLAKELPATILEDRHVSNNGGPVMHQFG